MTAYAELVEHLRRLEAEFMSPEVWQSRAELEACSRTVGIVDWRAPSSIEGGDDGFSHIDDWAP
jgi:hypothetical protein